MTLTEMLTLYEKHNASAAYALGFVHRHVLYSLTCHELPIECLKLDRASSARGGYATLRLRMSAAVKKALVASGKAEALGAETLLHADKYNRGECYERVLTERAGQVWVKDSAPFWERGDLRVNGVEVQVKLDGATIATEPELRKLLARG